MQNLANLQRLGSNRQTTSIFENYIKNIIASGSISKKQLRNIFALSSLLKNKQINLSALGDILKNQEQDIFAKANITALLQLLKSYVDTYGGVMWPFQETSGTYAVAYNTALAEGRNILIDGDMEAADTSAYTANDITLSKEATDPYEGSKVLRLTYNATAIGDARQTVLTVGKTYRVTGVARSDGNGIPNLRYGTTDIWTGTTSTDWQAFDEEFTADNTIFKLRVTNLAVGEYVEFDDVSVKQKNIAASSSFPGSEELTDGDMEAATTAAWSAANTAVLSKQTTNPHGGNRLLRVAYGSQANPIAGQTILTIGKRYRLTGYARGDGTTAPIIRMGGVNIFTGGTETDWITVSQEFEATATTIYIGSNGAGGGYSEWDDVSITEVNPLNGDIIGATVGQTGPKSDLSYLLDGINDDADIYSPELNGFFDSDQGTLLCFAKVSGSGVWTDETSRYVARIAVDGDNQLRLRKTETNNQLSFRYEAGGTQNTIALNSVTTTDWFLMAVTWDTTADEVKAYYNGSQTGSTQSGLGTWVGNLSDSDTVIGAGTTIPGGVWDGFITYPILFRDVLTLTDIQAIATAAGV